MVPKWDERRGYASQPRIHSHRPVALKQGIEPMAGPFMRHRKGQEMVESTMRVEELESCNHSQTCYAWRGTED
jgi:hypothetical protein